MMQTRYDLGTATLAAAGVEIHEAIDSQLDREVTCVVFSNGRTGNESELAAYKSLCRVSHPNTLEILDIVPSDEAFMIVTHRTHGVDVPAWLESCGPVHIRDSHRFAMEMLEWTLAWKATNHSWPYLIPGRIWIQEDEDGDLQLKIGRVTSPAPEAACLDSVRSAIAILMGKPENFPGAARGAMSRFFKTDSPQAAASIGEAHTMLEMSRPLLSSATSRLANFRWKKRPATTRSLSMLLRPENGSSD